MTEKTPDRLELSFGNFRASAVGKFAVGGLVVVAIVALVCKAAGIL